MVPLVGQLEYNKFIAWTCEIFKEVISSNLAEQFHAQTIFFTYTVIATNLPAFVWNIKL